MDCMIRMSEKSNRRYGSSSDTSGPLAVFLISGFWYLVSSYHLFFSSRKRASDRASPHSSTFKILLSSLQLLFVGLVYICHM